MEKEAVTLIAGKINSTSIVNYWRLDEDFILEDLGDYAIVENKQGYDLVEIVGFLDVTKNNAVLFSNTKYENMKKVVKFIGKEEMKNGD